MSKINIPAFLLFRIKEFFKYITYFVQLFFSQLHVTAIHDVVLQFLKLKILVMKNNMQKFFRHYLLLFLFLIK